MNCHPSCLICTSCVMSALQFCKRSPPLLHLRSYLYLPFLDSVFFEVPFSQQRCTRPKGRHGCNSEAGSTGPGWIPRQGSYAKGGEPNRPGGDGKNATVTGVARALEPSVKESWKLGPGAGAPDQLNQEPDEDLAVAIVVCVFLLQRSFPYHCSCEYRWSDGGEAGGVPCYKARVRETVSTHPLHESAHADMASP